MKKLFILLILLIPIYTKALTYEKTNNVIVDNIVSYKDTIIELNNNIVNSYVDNELIATKQFNDLTNINIINYNDNYMLVGKENNALKVYIIDNKLKVQSTKKTSYIINNTTPTLYKYDNKIYVLYINNGILKNNNIYIIDNELNIEETRLSNITNIKDIIKSDYYIINNSGTTRESKTYYYNSSTYTQDYNILVGYTNDNISNIELLDKEGYIIWEDNNINYDTYKDILISNNIIYVLAIKDNESYLVSYDMTGKLLESDKISENISTKMIKVLDKIYILTDNNELIYSYDILVNEEKSIYGTLKITGDIKPYNEINIEAIPNSGYELDNIIITDENGNNIEIIDNKFIMPTSSINIKVNYIENVINPETVDFILVFIIIAIIALILFNKSYKQYKWLRG